MTDSNTAATPQTQQAQTHEPVYQQSKIVEMSHSTPALSMARGVGIDVRMTRNGKTLQQGQVGGGADGFETAQNVDELAALLGEEIEKEYQAWQEGLGPWRPQGRRRQSERVIERLQNELNIMSNSLDESFRIRENQKWRSVPCASPVLRCLARDSWASSPPSRAWTGPTWGRAWRTP